MASEKISSFAIIGYFAGVFFTFCRTEVLKFDANKIFDRSTSILVVSI